MSFHTSDFTEIVSGLGYPEGPLWLPDGSLAVVDIKAKTLLRFRPDANGTYHLEDTIDLSDPSGRLDSGPNGAALGPDG